MTRIVIPSVVALTAVTATATAVFATARSDAELAAHTAPAAQPAASTVQTGPAVAPAASTAQRGTAARPATSTAHDHSGPDRGGHDHGGHDHGSHDHGSHDHGSPDRGGHDHGGGIGSPRGNAEPAAFDLVRTSVRRQGDRIVFTEQVRGRAGSVKPGRVGQFAGSSVFSYVWPISLNTSTAGFSRGSGVLALAATSHPDFDDTPLVDENRNGRKDDDGGLWHSHWVVLVPDTTRPDGALKVRDILPGERPQLPKTWPGVPLYLDSPSYPTKLTGQTVRIEVPLAALGFPKTFQYDGVTSALKVNADLHDPLLRVENVFDVASGDLSLPGTFRR
ncbi:hypothetical protein Ait01nite_059510 [Actinoplanes italicus]|uniref:Secreted protein n=1 Tax=Actinoplanes italicus TaxID=113567 RepID=A0A2T0K6G4_9ACTN|nr:hypothetical protein [Actinoplanes italicus]PRX18568.1 hypothetical protein CLV67_11242 [Actinoplanes italicus]GIE32906.1 hypothetical protein Ait01nite_059510 [Actinoplanes italicus]